MIKYEANTTREWMPEAIIKKVDVDRETESSAWINGSRRAKPGAFWDSFQEAKKALIMAAEEYIDRKRRAVIYAEKKLQRIKNLDELE